MFLRLSSYKIKRAVALEPAVFSMSSFLYYIMLYKNPDWAMCVA